MQERVENADVRLNRESAFSNLSCFAFQAPFRTTRILNSMTRLRSFQFLTSSKCQTFPITKNFPKRLIPEVHLADKSKQALIAIMSFLMRVRRRLQSLPAPISGQSRGTPHCMSTCTYRVCDDCTSRRPGRFGVSDSTDTGHQNRSRILRNRTDRRRTRPSPSGRHGDFEDQKSH
jgi:hypothetical protein